MKRVAACTLLAAVCAGVAFCAGSLAFAPYPVADFGLVRTGWRASDAWLLDRNGEPLSRVRIDHNRRRGDWLTMGEVSTALTAAVLESDKTGEPVTWRGTTRAPLVNLRAYPATENGRLTTWIGVGGSPESVVRAARYGIPMMLAIIGGDPRRFMPYVDLYKQALTGQGKAQLPIGVHSPGYVADHWCVKGHILLCTAGLLHTELQDGRVFTLAPGMSYQVADNAEPHRSSTKTGATLYIVD